jgi:hypothetical protein
MARDESRDIFVTSDDIDEVVSFGVADVLAATVCNAEPGDVRYIPASQYEELAKAAKYVTEIVRADLVSGSANDAIDRLKELL